MKQKKILAGIAAAAMALSLTGISAFAAALNDDSEDIEDEEVEEEILDEDIEDEDLEDVEDEDLGDEDLDDFDDFDDEDFDDFDDEEDEEEEEEETDDIVVVETTKDESPKTGNAPVALAVIPVALAAAAVIAKKSK